MALVSTYICPFCGHRLRSPAQESDPAERGPYNLDDYGVYRCACSAVAVCQADAVDRAWEPETLGKRLCTEVLRLDRGRCEVRSNLTESEPPYYVVWAKANP